MPRDRTKTQNTKARMTRKQPPTSMPGRRVEDPKQAYTKEQLQEVGAITLIWNQVDGFIDWLLHIALRPPIAVTWEVPSRISGSDAKLDILRIFAQRSDILTDEARACIKLTLDAVAEYKKYRDNIVHSVPYDIDKGIAHRVNRRAELWQTLVTIEALTGLYLRIKLLLDELREVDLLYRLADEEGAKIVYPAEPDPLARRRTRDVPIQTARLRERQKGRLSLPPLPEFPAEASVRAETEATKIHPGSEEKDC